VIGAWVLLGLCTLLFLALGAFQGQWGTDIPLLCAGSLLILAPTPRSSSSSNAGSSPPCSTAH
jgi:hypothetical protein